MPYLTTLFLGVSAGITGYAAVTHLLVGLARRPRDQTHLIFALLSLSVASHTLAVLVMQNATSLAGYIFIHKYLFGPTALAAFVSFMWFVACYTGVSPGRFLIAMSLWITLNIALHVILPFGILYSDISGLRQITLPWGEQIVSARGTPNPLRLSFDLFNLALFIFFFYALVRQYRGGHRRRALMLGLALVVFLAGRVIDSLIGLGVLTMMRTSELAFTGVVITMSLVLSYEVTEADQELHTYQQHLQDLVTARTAELWASNEQLEQQRQLAERRRRVAEHLSDLLDLLNADQPIDTLWRQITAAISPLFGVQATAIYQYADGVYTPLAASGESEDVAATLLRSSQPALEQALADSLPVTMNLSAEEAAAPDTAFATMIEPACSCVLAVPLVSGDSFMGGIVLGYASPRTFTSEELALAVAFGDQVVLVIENAQLRRQVALAAASEERTRLAHELHDSVTQTLFSASLLAEALPGVWNHNAAEGAQNLAELRQLVRGALAEMRTLLFELRPAALVAADLDTLLKHLGNVLTGHTSIPVELVIEGTADVPADIKIALYRIAQEAFNNIARHASAAQVGVTLRAAPGALFLAVCDDGQGFDPGAVSEDHMGVRIMAERAAGIGARLRIDSAPRRGTEVSVSWPDPER